MNRKKGDLGEHRIGENPSLKTDLENTYSSKVWKHIWGEIITDGKPEYVQIVVNLVTE